MAVVLFRGSLESGGVENTLLLATIYLVVFSVVGALIGQFAQATIDESVRAKLEQQLTRPPAKAGA
jgi:sensor domain CHASE-containing protein